MTFQVFRMLSTGMSESEVFVLAGEPDGEFDPLHWLYHRDDGYVVELTFSGGRLMRIVEAKKGAD